MNTNIRNKKLAILAIVFIILSVACLAFGLAPQKAYADTTEHTATFYSDTDIENGTSTLFTTITTVNGSFTVPKDAPTKAGYTFTTWSDGWAHYDIGKTYTITSDIKLSAVYTEVVTEKPYARMSAGTIASIVSVVVVMLALILFFYYWCGVKGRSIKLIPQYIKKLFTKKDKNITKK